MRAPWNVCGWHTCRRWRDRLSLWHLHLDGIEEADELLMAVALHVVSDDGAVEDVEGGEQRGCAVTFVVMRKPLKQSSLITRRRENGSAPPSVTVFGFAIQKSYAIANARALAFSYSALRTISQLLGWFSAVSALGAY
jgi:hypothetical protein